MLQHLLQLVPPDAVKLTLVLLLSLLLGLEREEHKLHDAQYAFGGIRTFPLIGLAGYLLAFLSGQSPWPWCAGLLVIGGLMLLSYRHKLSRHEPAGVTTELAGIIVYLVGTLVWHDQFWIATTVAVLCTLLLELKSALERVAQHIELDEIISFSKFLVLTVVILPIVPNHEYSRFHINPFTTWLVVIAVSGVSYGSYVLQRVLKNRGGVFLSAILGGAYSSTVTTVVLARQAKKNPHPNLFAGSIVAASGMMYARLALLLSFFNRALMVKLAPSLTVLALVGSTAGFAISRRRDEQAALQNPQSAKNPLELRAALLFATIFVGMLILTSLAREYLGRLGLYALAAVMGIADVDPFILGLTQTSPVATPLQVTSSAIIIAAASNNIVKGIYALSFADRTTGRRSFALLVALALLGILPLLWM